jgi:hypothetical protein
MLECRYFPRYDITVFQLKAQVKGEEIQSASIVNIGIGGIQIEMEEKLKFSYKYELKIPFGKRVFSLSGETKWLYEIPNEKKFRYGLKVEFSHMDSFSKWLVFVKVLHKRAQDKK